MSFAKQELKDLLASLNMAIDWYSGLSAPNTMSRLYELQNKIIKMIKEEE